MLSSGYIKEGELWSVFGLNKKVLTSCEEAGLLDTRGVLV